MGALARLRARGAQDAAFLSAVVAAVAAMHVTHFGLPPLNPDESSFFIMNLSLISEPGSAWHDYSLSLGSHIGSFPVLFAQYIGVLGAYASLPFHHAFGPSVEAVRSYNMFVAILITLAVYLTAREMFSRAAATVAASAFVVFPLVVFYSRQSIMYDWIILAVAVLMLYFGTRFLRGGSLWYLGAAILSGCLIIWAYLSSLWFVLGVIAALPICVASFRARGRMDTRKVVLAGAIFVLVGSAPFVAHHVLSPNNSYIALILLTIEDAGSQDQLSGHLVSGTDNSDILQNLYTRSDHLHSILTRPVMGFWAADLQTPDDLSYRLHAYDATFLVLFLASVAVALAELARRGPYWRKMAGLLVVLAVIFVTSTFTVTVLNPLQLGLMLPFVFLLIGCSMDRATRWLACRRVLGRYGVRQLHAVLLLVGVVAALQAPHIYGGFELLAEDGAHDYRVPAGELGMHVVENGLTPVAMDWYTYKSLFFILEGVSVPIVITGEFEGKEFNQEVRGNMYTAESADLVRDDLLFVIYLYPDILDCRGDLSPSDIPRSNQCAQAYFVESAAERNGLDVVVKDFDLPNGLPYYRTLQFAQGL